MKPHFCKTKMRKIVVILQKTDCKCETADSLTHYCTVHGLYHSLYMECAFAAQTVIQDTHSLGKFNTTCVLDFVFISLVVSIFSPEQYKS